jgi:hypothetical protein
MQKKHLTKTQHPSELEKQRGQGRENRNKKTKMLNLSQNDSTEENSSVKTCTGPQRKYVYVSLSTNKCVPVE